MDKQIIISIGREYGSGGREVAGKIAGDLGLKLYDRNILNEISKEKHIEVAQLEKLDEKPRRLLDSRRVGGYSNSMQEIIAEYQFDYIRDKAKTGESFVIVGRCAEMVLKEYEGLLSIFIVGDLPFRIERVKGYENLDDHGAAMRVRQIDRKRKQYHDHYSDGRWGDSRMYDLCINSSRIGIEKTIEVIESYIRVRVS